MISHGIDSMPGGGAEILMKMLEKEYVEEKLLQSNGWIFTSFGMKKR